MPEDERKDIAEGEEKGEAGGNETGAPESEEDQDQNQEKLLLESPLIYSLASDGNVTSEGEGAGQLYEEKMTVLPKFGQILPFPLRSILEYQARDYKIRIIFSSNDQLTLSNLGLRYEDFVRKMAQLRNQLILKDVLMEEKLRQPTARGSVIFTGSSGTARLAAECELRLYETALVIVPDIGDLIRIPYSDITGISAQDYRLEITTEFGDKLVASQMGRLFDPFARALAEANSALQLKVNSVLMKLLPLADPAELRKVAHLMKEGRAARKSDIDSVSPAVWSQLEKRLVSVGIAEEYPFLKGLSQADRICIGIKQGLRGDLTSEYLWFLVPIYSSSPDTPGNAIAMEASSNEGSGRATYFFRITGRKEYKEMGLDKLSAECDKLTGSINRAMIEINFRREPIYLEDGKLNEPPYQKYLFAAKRLPSLQALRSLFIGRVIHSTPEQWQADVLALLKFNVVAEDDGVKWSKS